MEYLKSAPEGQLKRFQTSSTSAKEWWKGSEKNWKLQNIVTVKMKSWDRRSVAGICHWITGGHQQWSQYWWEKSVEKKVNQVDDAWNIRYFSYENKKGTLWLFAGKRLQNTKKLITKFKHLLELDMSLLFDVKNICSEQGWTLRTTGG